MAFRRAKRPPQHMMLMNFQADMTREHNRTKARMNPKTPAASESACSQSNPQMIS